MTDALDEIISMSNDDDIKSKVIERSGKKNKGKEEKMKTNGESANINEADKYETIEDAKKELKDYDEDFSGAIYKVIEYKSINLEKVE